LFVDRGWVCEAGEGGVRVWVRAGFGGEVRVQVFNVAVCLADEAVYFFDVLFEVDFALLAELAWGVSWAVLVLILDLDLGRGFSLGLCL
jgi:hypothetical protein